MKNRGLIIGVIGLALISVSLIVPSIGAERHPSSPGCMGCQNDQPQPRRASQCLEFIQVELGQKVRILQTDGASFPGTWEADFGKIGEDGTYIAPRNIAAPGIDHIRFSGVQSPTAASFTVLVQLMPSTRTPDPASEQLDLADELAGPYEGFDEPGTGGLGAEDSITDVEMLDPPTIEQLPAMMVGSRTGYRIPVIHDPGSSTDVALVYAYSTTAQVGKTCGVFPKPKGGCTGNELKEVKGPVKFDRKPWQHRSKLFEVTAKVSIKIGIEVGAKVTVEYDLREVTAYYYKDMYQCISGVWHYSGTQICRSRGLEYKSIDPTYGVWFLFPITGTKTITFDPWACEVYEK